MLSYVEESSSHIFNVKGEEIHHTRRLLLLAALVLFSACAAAPSGTVTDPTTLRGPSESAVTVPGKGIRLGGILIRPGSADSDAPAVIVLHGWAERGARGAVQVLEHASRLATEGYVTLALSMRGWPDSQGVDDCGFEQPADIAKGIEWLASVPGVDRDRIGVWGFSQGGQVALLAGALTDRIKAIVAYYPVTDVERWRTTTTHPTIPQYIRLICEPGGTSFRSPVHAAKEMKAPVLLVHGAHDMRVPTEQSFLMMDALLGAGKHVEIEVVPFAEHGSRLVHDRAWSATLRFFNTYLKRTGG